MIVTVYKPSRRKNGERVVARIYRGRYRLDPREKLKDVPLYTSDKQVAEQKLRKILQEEQRERDGIRAPREQRDAASGSLRVHITDYIADRRAIGRDEKYVRELERKLLKLGAECGWECAGRVTPESFCTWRAKQRKNPKTLNEYLSAAAGLLNWLEPRLGSNPLRHVQKVQTSGAPHRERRAFTEEELQRLTITGGLRGVVYLVAARTGIRRGELEKIEWRDVHLDALQPFIMVRAAVSKNGRQAMQPLTPDVVEALQSLHLQGEPNERVFTELLPRMDLFRKDLASAGIAYSDNRGQIADFHALRKTYGTALTLAGVGERTVMELMRHSDMRLTAKTYTDANQLPISDAMASLMKFAQRRADSQIDSQELVPDSPSVSVSRSRQVSREC